ncbi:hypothetical protein PCE1_000010 [Barthelona sp. PCE]
MPPSSRAKRVKKGLGISGVPVKMHKPPSKVSNSKRVVTSEECSRLTSMLTEVMGQLPALVDGGALNRAQFKLVKQLRVLDRIVKEERLFAPPAEPKMSARFSLKSPNAKIPPEVMHKKKPVKAREQLVFEETARETVPQPHIPSDDPDAMALWFKKEYHSDMLESCELDVRMNERSVNDISSHTADLYTDKEEDIPFVEKTGHRSGIHALYAELGNSQGFPDPKIIDELDPEDTSEVLQACELYLEDLRRKEKEFTVERTKDEIEKVREPRPGWYTLKTREFQEEAAIALIPKKAQTARKKYRELLMKM